MKLSSLYGNIKSKTWEALKRPLRRLDDVRYLKLKYWILMGKPLNLDSPSGFNEKIQWLKLNNRKPIYTTLVDKYEVKEWVAGKIGGSHVIPTLGVWDSFDEIDFDNLPEQFVLKCTHDSGHIAICDDRSTFDRQADRRKFEESLARNFFYTAREWPYLNVKPRILAEVYLPTWQPDGAASGSDLKALERATRYGLTDYKFYCFHGEPKFLSVSEGLQDHATAMRVFLNLDWTPTGFSGSDYLPFTEIPARPAHLENMIEIARQLSEGIPFVRVDLYEHIGRVLFSELTFSPSGGYTPFVPKSADKEIGDMLDLSRVAVTK
ncbi:MAG: ATP-grasp fold amidoligase family protein [Leucobacter sp.]